MINAVEAVKERACRAAAALEQAGIPYAVAGGNAVAAWVATIDRAAVRNTQDVDILIRRADLPAAKAALEAVGFVHRRAAGLDLFLDNANVNPRHAVHLAFADEIVKPGEPAANPGVKECTDFGSLRVINLEALVRIKLTAFRRKDQVHILDLIEVGLIEASWTKRFSSLLAERLQTLLNTPDG